LNYDAILFDFDGVLVDSEPLHWRCWAEIVRPFGIEFDWETYQRIAVGVADRKVMELLAAMAKPPIDPLILHEKFPLKQRMYLDLLFTSPVLSQGLLELLKEVCILQLAVVTSSYRSEVEPVLVATGIRSYFAAVIASDDVTEHKPAPEPYLLAARRLGARRPLVIEDSAAGVASARAAGFDVIRVAHPAQVAPALRAALAAGAVPGNR
jgi:beta-phosphoglucomutase